MFCIITHPISITQDSKKRLSAQLGWSKINKIIPAIAACSTLITWIFFIFLTSECHVVIMDLALAGSEVGLYLGFKG